MKILGNNVNAYLCNDINIEPNKAYSLSVMEKAKDVTKNTTGLGASVYLIQINASGDIISNTEKWKSNDGTFDWSQVKINFVASPDAKKVIVLLALEGGGTVWYDDAKLIDIVGVKGITLSKSSTVITKGQIEKLTATIEPVSAADKNVIWTVQSQSTNNVVTISDTGIITAITPGIATVRATSALDSSKYAECTVTVRQVVGDLNGDNKITKEDTEIIKNYLLGKAPSIDSTKADIDGDGKITSKDYALLLKNISYTK